MSGEGRIDLQARAVVASDGTETPLSAREVQVLRVLTEARGSPVARATLERDVWGHAEQVRSEAVPVAMRRLRAKVGDVLQTVRGFGWSLAVPEPLEPLPRPPRPQSPWLERPASQEHLKRQLVAGARLIAVVGAPGMGKTRIVQETLSTAMWVGLTGQVHDQHAVIEGVAAALGTRHSDVDRVLEALQDRAPEVVVLDGGQAFDGAAFELAKRLAGVVPVVLVCREAPAAPGCTVWSVPPLEPGQSAALYALRAGQPASPRVEPQLARCDGVPAVIELLAARAWMGEPLIVALEGASPLEAAIEEGWRRARPEQRRALAFLAGLGAPMPLAELQGHPWVLAEVPDLVRRSLVQPARDGSLTVLHPIRMTCLERPEAREPVQQARRFLVERAEALVERVPAEPRASLEALEALTSGLDRVVREAEPLLAARAALALCPVARRRGPVVAHRRRVEVALEHPLPAALREPLLVEHASLVCAEGRAHADVLAPIASIDTPRAHQVRGILAEVTGRPGEALGHYERAMRVAPEGDGTAMLAWARAVSLRQVLEGRPVDEAIDELAGIQAACETGGRRELVPEILRARVLLVLRHGALHQATVLAAELLEQVAACGLLRQACSAWNTFGMCLLEEDLSQAEHAFGRALAEGRRLGEATTVFAVNQAWCRLCLDRPAGALALLEPVGEHSARMRPLADLVCYAAHLRLGHGLDARRIRLTLDVQGLGRLFTSQPGFGEALVEVAGLLGPDATEVEAILGRSAALGRDPRGATLRQLTTYVETVLRA